jgi:hypothetical protein
MGEWSVAYVMEKGCGHHQPAIVISKPELAAGDTGQVHRPHRMFKPCMVGPGIYEIRKPELTDITQALDGRGIQERQDLLIHFHIAMDRILDDLETH